jgi:CheY-like chemotaxis protein
VALSGNYQLVVLDVMLPDVKGFEVLPELRGSMRTPVVILTAKGEESDRVLGLEMDADDYFSKPFSPRELLDSRSPPDAFPTGVLCEQADGGASNDTPQDGSQVPDQNVVFIQIRAEDLQHGEPAQTGQRAPGCASQHRAEDCAATQHKPQQGCCRNGTCQSDFET